MQNEINEILDIAYSNDTIATVWNLEIGQAAFAAKWGKIYRLEKIDGEWEIVEEIQCRSQLRALSGIDKINQEMKQAEEWLAA